MITTIVILSALLIIVLLWALSIKDPYFPVNPYWDYDYKSTEISRLEMENCQLRNDLNRYKFNERNLYAQDLNFLRYRDEIEKMRFRSMSEQEQMAKKLSEAMKPLEKLKEELTN